MLNDKCKSSPGKRWTLLIKTDLYNQRYFWPLPHRDPPSKQNFPSTVPKRRRSVTFQEWRMRGGTCAVRQNWRPCIRRRTPSTDSRLPEGTFTSCTGNWNSARPIKTKKPLSNTTENCLMKDVIKTTSNMMHAVTTIRQVQAKLSINLSEQSKRIIILIPYVMSKTSCSELARFLKKLLKAWCAWVSNQRSPVNFQRSCHDGWQPPPIWWSVYLWCSDIYTWPKCYKDIFSYWHYLLGIIIY